MTIPVFAIPRPVIAVASLFWGLALLASFTWQADLEAQSISVMFIALFAALGLSDAAGLKQRAWSVPLSGFLIACGCFWALAIASLFWTELMFVSWIGFFLFSALPFSIAFFLVGHDCALRLKWGGLLVRLIVTGLSVYALYQYGFRHDLLYSGRVHEPLADPNGLAAVFSLGLFYLLGQVQKATPNKNLDLVLLVVWFAGFLTTGSRTAFAALAIMGFVFIACTGVRQFMTRGWLLTLVGAVAGLVAAVILAPTEISGPLNMIRHTLDTGFSFSFSERPYIWSATLDMIQARPWLGSGVGTFASYYPEFRHPLDTTVGLMAHNDPLHYAAEMGMGALIIFYAIFVWGVVRTIKGFRSAAAPDGSRAEILAYGVGLATMTLHSHFTYNFHVLPCLILSGFLFACWYHSIAAASGEAPKIIKAPDSLHKITALLGLMLCWGLLSVAIVAPILSQPLLKRAEESLFIGELDSYTQEVNLAEKLSFGLNARVYAVAATVPLAILMQSETPPSPQDQASLVEQADGLLAKARTLNPRDPQVLIQSADLAAYRGQPQAAETLLRSALDLDPLKLVALLKLADNLRAQGRGDEADALLANAAIRTYDPRERVFLTRYYEQVLAIFEKSGNKVMADRVREQLGRLKP